MNHLLVADTFDGFLLEEAVISTANTFTIDGHINRDFFAAEDEDTLKAMPEFRPWRELKGMCFDLIKGKRTPLSFKFVLILSEDKMISLLEKNNCDVLPANVKALVLNIRYDGSRAVLTTGTSLRTFLLSREPDLIWDRAMQQYLEHNGISYEIL